MPSRRHALAAPLAALLAGACSADRIAAPASGSPAPQEGPVVSFTCRSSIPAGVPALIVVDGEVWGTSDELQGWLTERLDAQRIESIEVLKTSAAVPRYGERARNGAILVRTRSGESPRP